MKRPRRGDSLRHLLVAGGSVTEWASFSDDAWQKRLDMLVDLAKEFGFEFVTVHPHEIPGSGILAPSSVDQDEDSLHSAAPLAASSKRIESEREGVRVVVDPLVDGRQRICEKVEQWPQGEFLNERTLGRALFGAAGEPDLVVVLGPANRLPSSLVWELAYGELVFIDVPWDQFGSAHVRAAIVDFSLRQRRFGGVE